MTVFICIDDKGGMTFCGKRQSRDSMLIKDVAAHAEDGLLYISDFSEKLFLDSDASVISVPDPLGSAGEGGFAFVETPPLAPYKDKIKTLVIYKWNRHYPSDKKLDISPRDMGMHLAHTYDFKGTSHENITKEVYER